MKAKQFMCYKNQMFSRPVETESGDGGLEVW